MLVKQFLRPVRNIVTLSSRPVASSFGAAALIPSSSFHISSRRLQAEETEAPAFISTGDAPVPDNVKRVAEEILNFNIEEMNLFLTYMQVCICLSLSLFSFISIFISFLFFVFVFPSIFFIH